MSVTTPRGVALALAAGLAAVAGGCSNSGMLDDIKEGNYFRTPVVQTPSWAKVGRGAHMNASLGPKGPVAPEDLVNAAGQCAAEAPAAPPAAPAQAEPAVAQAEPAVAQAEPVAAQAEPVTPEAARAKAAVGSIAGDLASAPMPQGPPPAPPAPKPKKVAATAPADALGGLQPEGPGGAGAAAVVGGISLGMTECQAVRRAGQPTQVNIGAADGGERKVVLSYLSGPWPGIYTFQSGRLKVIDAAPAPPKPAKPERKKKPSRAPAQAAVSAR